MREIRFIGRVVVMFIAGVVIAGLSVASPALAKQSEKTGVCEGLSDGTLYGLCNAYCERLDCAAEEEGNPSRPCERLLRNWGRRATESFPCANKRSPIVYCGDAHDAQCNGVCAEGEECTADAATGGCACAIKVPSCGDAQAGMCFGDCPPDMPWCRDFGFLCTCSFF